MQINSLAGPTVILAALSFWIGWRAERGLNGRRAHALFVVVASVFAIPSLLYISFYSHLFDGAAWFYNFRALPYTELAASGIGLLAGYIHSASQPESTGEKLVIPVALFVLIAIPFMKPVLSPLEWTEVRDRCSDGICLQSTPSTCGPASAATLIQSFGKAASERELARESFTYRGGTENWYLARALQKRGFQAKVVIRDPAGMVPVQSIAGVTLPGGAGHFVAVLSETPTDITLVDPLLGKLVIPKAELRKRYQFTGFFLVVRPKL